MKEVVQLVLRYHSLPGSCTREKHWSAVSWGDQTQVHVCPSSQGHQTQLHVRESVTRGVGVQLRAKVSLTHKWLALTFEPPRAAAKETALETWGQKSVQERNAAVEEESPKRKSSSGAIDVQSQQNKRTMEFMNSSIALAARAHSR